MQKIFIPVDNDQSIAALIFAPESGPRGAVAVCHGFRGAKENSGKICAFAGKLTARGLMVIAFDFRGSGESSGEFSAITLSQQVEDLKQVCAYINSRYQLSFVLLGRSFGGATVIAAAPHVPEASGYVLWSAPFDLPRSFARLLGDDYQRLLNGASVICSDLESCFELRPDLVLDFKRHDMAGSLMAMRDKPVLVVHGREDEAVGIENAQEIATYLPEAVLHLVAGADHRFTGMVEQREAITLNWIDEHFGENRL
jgi:putative redox protein